MLVLTCLLLTGQTACAQNTMRPATTDPDGTVHTNELALAVPILDGEVMPEQTDAETAAFLDELSSVEITALRSQMIATRFFEFADTQTRKGNLYYTASRSSDGDVVRKFGAYFNTLFVGTFSEAGAREEPYQRAFVFDGRMLIEIDEDTNPRLFKRREVIGPGEKLDPMSLDQGIFPLPIGQKREEILKRYNARLAPAAEGLMVNPSDAEFWNEKEIIFFHALAKFHQDNKSVQLVLEPRNGANSDMRQIRLWYTQTDAGDGASVWLPSLARTIDGAGDISFIQLQSPAINGRAEVPEGALNLQPPADPRGWTIPSIEPYREAIVNAPDSSRE